MTNRKDRIYEIREMPRWEIEQKLYMAEGNDDVAHDVLEGMNTMYDELHKEVIILRELLNQKNEKEERGQTKDWWINYAVELYRELLKTISEKDLIVERLECAQNEALIANKELLRR